MRVDERMTKNICCCRSDESLAAAARQLWDNDCGCLPVLDRRGQLRGMITDRDICMAAMTTGKPLAELRVGDAMAKDVACARPSESLQDAELTMRSRAVRRLPVLDEQNHVIGLLTCNDLFRWVDDGGANVGTHHDAVHLVRTLATIGRTRRPQAVKVVAHHNGVASAPPSSLSPSSVSQFSVSQRSVSQSSGSSPSSAPTPARHRQTAAATAPAVPPDDAFASAAATVSPPRA